MGNERGEVASWLSGDGRHRHRVRIRFRVWLVPFVSGYAHVFILRCAAVVTLSV